MKDLFHGNGSTEVSVLSLKKTKQPEVIIFVFVPQRFAPWTLCFTPSHCGYKNVDPQVDDFYFYFFTCLWC